MDLGLVQWAGLWKVGRLWASKVVQVVRLSGLLPRTDRLVFLVHRSMHAVVFAIFLYHYIRSYITWDEQSGAVQHKTRQDESSMRGRVGMYGGSGTAASSTPYIRFHVHYSPS